MPVFKHPAILNVIRVTRKYKRTFIIFSASKHFEKDPVPHAATVLYTKNKKIYLHNITIDNVITRQ